MSYVPPIQNECLNSIVTFVRSQRLTFVQIKFQQELPGFGYQKSSIAWAITKPTQPHAFARIGARKADGCHQDSCAAKVRLSSFPGRKDFDLPVVAPPRVRHSG